LQSVIDIPARGNRERRRAGGPFQFRRSGEFRFRLGAGVQGQGNAAVGFSDHDVKKSVAIEVSGGDRADAAEAERRTASRGVDKGSERKFGCRLAQFWSLTLV